MSFKRAIDVIIQFDTSTPTKELPKTTGKPPKTTKKWREKTNESQKITEEPPETTLLPPKPLKETANLSKLGRFGNFVNRAIASLFCTKQPHQESSETSDSEDEDSLEDGLFKPFGATFKREGLNTQIKTSFDENMDALGLNFEYLYGIENGNILAEDITEEFQSLDSERDNLVFLWSSYVKRYDLLEPLYKLNANIHSTLQNVGFNALHLAALSGCVKSCEWLVSKGLDPNLTVDGLSPLHCAIIGDSLDCTKLLLSQGAVLDNTALDYAFEDHATNCLQQVLNEYVKRNAADEDGLTDLDRGMEKCLQIMTSYFPEADRTTTPLHLAAGSNLFECCQFLLEGGADPNEADHKGRTALHFAAKARSSECLKLMLKAGCDVNAQAVDDRTPLHMTVSGWNPYSPAIDALKVLVKEKADVNVSDRFGFTPLHSAASNSMGIQDPLPCIDRLIMSGANVTARSHDGVSALNLICRNTPGCMSAICRKLDSSISVLANGSNDRQNLRLKFNFLYLLDDSSAERMSFLKTLEKEGQKHLIEHPLCQAFLHLHWQQIRRFYFCHLFLWFVSAILLTVYVIYALAHECYNAAILTKTCESCLNNGTVLNQAAKNSSIEAREVCMTYLTNLNSTSKHISTEALKVCLKNSAALNSVAKNISTAGVRLCWRNSVIGPFLMKRLDFILCSWRILFLMAILESIRKIWISLSLISEKHYFFLLENISEWLVIVSVFMMSASWHGRINDWQKNIGGVAVLFAWFDCTIMIRRLPIFDTYKAMLVRVQTEFFKLLLLNSCLLIGLACFFCVLFPKDETFQNPMDVFINIFGIIAGDLRIPTLEEYPNLGISPLFYISYFLVIFISVVFMTLIGIAVHDIQNLRRTARLSKLLRQMELIYFLETVIHRIHLPKIIVKLLFEKLWQRVEVSSFSSKLPPYESLLPRRILKLAINVVKRKEKWIDSTCCGLDKPKDRADSMANQEEKISREDLRQLKDTISKFVKNSSNNLSEERFIKLEQHLHQELQQFKDVNREQSKLISRLMIKSSNNLCEERFIKLEQLLQQELQQFKDENRNQSKLISRLMNNSCNNLSEEKFVKHEKSLYEELRQLKEMVRAQNDTSLRLRQSL